MSHAFSVEQSAAAQTAFAGLSDAAAQADLVRSVANLPGGFHKKLIKGRSFWYYQRKDPDGIGRQIYVGPDDEPTRRVIEQHHNPAVKRGSAHLRQLTHAALALGCSQVMTKHGRVLRRLAEHGFFKSGGILVGTHAYLAYQNLLGVKWISGNTTMDIDFAHAGNNLSIALPTSIPTDTRRAIDSLQMGLVPNNASTSFKKTDEPDFDLDFLTSVGRDGGRPVESKLLNVRLQPLSFMEFSMEAPLITAVLDNHGPIVVNLPAPERYAIHKLIVYGERPQNQRTKAIKDLVQCASLFELLGEVYPERLSNSWNDATSRGRGWASRLRTGFNAMCEKFPSMDFEQMLARGAPVQDEFEGNAADDGEEKSEIIDRQGVRDI